MDAVDNHSAESRVRVAVVANAEEDRAALSSAFAFDGSRHRVVCSVDLGRAVEMIRAQDGVDAVVGFVEGPEEWARFASLAREIPDATSVMLVSDPERLDRDGDGAVLNAIVCTSRDELGTRAASTLNDLGPAGAPVESANAADRRRLAQLTEREREILTLTARGLSLKEIAREIHRGYGTVATHRMNIMEKLGLHDRVALARFAIRTGLIEA